MHGSGTSRGAFVVGALLIVLGAAALVIRVSGLTIGWPAWVILPGLALLIGSFALPAPGGSGLSAVGGLVTAVGTVLAGAGRVRLTTPHPASWSWDWGRAPFNWRVAISAEVPLRLEVETGASDNELDLSGLHVTDLRLRTGAAQSRVTLPASGVTRVNAEGGAAQVHFRVPAGVAARITSTMAIGTTDVDTSRFPRTPDGAAWASPDFDAKPNRVEIAVRGGVGQVTIG